MMACAPFRRLVAMVSYLPHPWVPLVLLLRAARARTRPPPAAVPDVGYAQRPARQSADAFLLADPLRPVHMRTLHPLHPLSEEEAVRGLLIDIVTQKTRRTRNYCLKKLGV